MATIDLISGDVVLFRTPLSLNPMTWLSWCIRHITGYAYNHVAICVCNWETPFLNEAVGRGVVTNPAAPRLEGRRYKVLRMPLLPFPDERAFAVRANSLIDRTKYSPTRLLLYQLWKHLTGHWALSAAKSKDTSRMICSEYAAWALSMEGWEQYSPEDFEISGLFYEVSSR